MSLFSVRFFCFIALLPLLYVVAKVARRRDINFIDLLMVFYGLSFCASPLLASEMSYIEWGAFSLYETEASLIHFLVYSSFSMCLLVFNVIWSNLKGDSSSIINVTNFLSVITDCKRNKIREMCFMIVAIISIVYLLPRASVTVRAESLIDKVQSYKETTTTQLLTSIVTYIIPLNVLCVLLKRNYKARNEYISLLLFAVFCVFMPRRFLVQQIVLAGVMVYSLHRKVFFSRKFVIAAMFGALLLWQVFFPFYNSFRHSDVFFDEKKPISSLVGIIEYGVENFSSDRDEKKAATESRSLGIYIASVRMLVEGGELWLGRGLLQSIGCSVPKFIYPQKPICPEGELEKKMGLNVDSADSIFLLFNADFGVMAGVFVAVFLIALLFFYDFVVVIFNRAHIGIGGFVVFVAVLVMCWNVEGKPEMTMVRFLLGDVAIVAMLHYFYIARLKVNETGKFELY